ncbi:MAG: hypothetical protein ABIT04_05960 [Novosphingobium sp.]
MLPVAYSYETRNVTLARLELPLAPCGREVASELRWSARLQRGAASASVVYRKDSGHYAALRDDFGAAFAWRRGF